METVNTKVPVSKSDTTWGEMKVKTLVRDKEIIPGAKSRGLIHLMQKLILPAKLKSTGTYKSQFKLEAINIR